ncbi:class I SAM-dependent methyltransferase [Flagellimonas sp. HMM57]|uniref:THUMP-like domain-containing protein n=1 Tax=unclassified Flagellimonas TaxID=2644544 RepID=UPI0013D7D04E|nr:MULTISPECIES: class I SAM-dependent methyltransferase [unclassified Flagellimonas]UII76170.1 class I SAM-dependent methyltransferase [Flagellimonas sp. HMM57]
MNKILLNTGVQNFIKNNWNTDIVSVLLQKPIFKGISQKELAEQLESKKKCKGKLPTWFDTNTIYFPNKRNIEQTSSELTAHYKSNLITGKTLLDVTGGFGVDSYFFSKKIDSVLHCEINKELSEIAAHNFRMLGQNNVQCIAVNGIDYLEKNEQRFDWLYIDPSRRDDTLGKVFKLKDCLPNLPLHLKLFFDRTRQILVKTSPLLDISQSLKELEFVKEIHVVAIDNDVKELLYILEYGFEEEITIKTINLTQDREAIFSFKLNEEQNIISEYGDPQHYLYESNSAILKSGGFKSVGKRFGLKKLHQHSHLYTSQKLVDFPGRRFEIVKVLPYSKKSIKELSLNNANITIRNFPISVAEIRKKHKIKDGGDAYLFFTTAMDGKRIIINCKRA